MKILRIHESHHLKGGAGIHIRRLQEGMAALGVESPLMSIDKKTDGYEVEFGTTKHQKLARNQAIAILESILEQGRFDAVQVHGVSVPKILKALFAIFSGPIVRYLHEPRLVCPGHGKFWYQQRKPCDKPWGFRCFANAYRETCAPRDPAKLMAAWQNTRFEVSIASQRYDRLIVASEYMKAIAIEGGLPAARVIKIPPPQSIPEILAEPEQESGARLLYVGRIAATKGTDLMIDSLAPLLSQRPNVTLDIVGDGIGRSALEAAIDKHQLQEQVLLHGWKSPKDTQSFYRRSSLVLFPSVYPEAFGNVGPEAMLQGKAVIAFDTGGVSEWLVHEQNGLLVPNKNLKAFREATARLLDDTDLASKLGKQGQAFIQKHFSAEKISQQYLSLFQHLIQERASIQPDVSPPTGTPL